MRQPFEVGRVLPRDRTEGEGERLAPLYSTVIVPAMRGDAVGVFMTFMGVPADQLDGMRQYPMWPMWEAIAPTLAYDASVLGRDSSVPTARAELLAVPALVMDGSATEWPFMRATAAALAQAIPKAQHRTLEGQTHEVTADALAPVLVEFFTSIAVVR